MLTRSWHPPAHARARQRCAFYHHHSLCSLVVFTSLLNFTACRARRASREKRTKEKGKWHGRSSAQTGTHPRAPKTYRERGSWASEAGTEGGVAAASGAEHRLRPGTHRASQCSEAEQNANHSPWQLPGDRLLHTPSPALPRADTHASASQQRGGGWEEKREKARSESRRKTGHHDGPGGTLFPLLLGRCVQGVCESSKGRSRQKRGAKGTGDWQSATNVQELFSNNFGCIRGPA